MSVYTVIFTPSKELEYLYRKTELVSFPVAEEYQSLIDIMQHLLVESSVAYQIVVNDIANNKDYLNLLISGRN